MSNAPIPANNRPSAHILNAEATTKTPFRGCLSLKFQASLTFLKSSSYAAFEKRPPCPFFDCTIMRSEGMGLFESTHLPDQNPSALYCGPSRGLHLRSLMVSIAICSGRPQRGPLTTAGVDAALRRMPCRALTGIAQQDNPTLRATFPLLD